MQIAGRVAEVASGKDWQTLFRERIAEPLGMTATDYEYKGPTQNPRISGGARSDVGDYMKFLTMIRQRGIYDGRRVLSTRAIDVMLADQTGGVPIMESPFQRVPGEYRYGIGNWRENPDSRGRTTQNSSIGVAGWTPWIDASRNLQVVVGMQNVLKPFQPYYPQMKQILQTLIPPAGLTPIGVTNAASYEAGPIAPGELLALFGSSLGPALFAAEATGIGQGAVLNQDGTINSASNPARRGSMPVLFGTGACLTDGTRGSLLSLTIGAQQAPISFCGPVPGLPPGVFQLNATVPSESAVGSTLPVVIQIGCNASLPVITVAVK